MRSPISRSAIGAVYCTTADRALDREGVHREDRDSLSRMTLCVIVMRNGYIVIGKSAPASPENFARNLGRKFAYEDAVRQVWPLMGFALRDRLARGE